MDANKKKRWIVLVNRSPRGPFLEKELHQLIDQRVIRPNDIAYLVPEHSDSEKAAWKFLWQFEQFDSRKNEQKESLPAAILEKRMPKTPEQVQAQIDEQLPLDLQSIRVEDLIVRANEGSRREPFIPRGNPERESVSRVPSSGGFSFKFGTAPLVLALIVGVGLWVKRGNVKEAAVETNREITSVNAKTPPSRPLMLRGAPQARGNSPVEMPNPGINRPVPPPPQMGSAQPIPVSAPRPRDAGEIDLEERRKQREEEFRREAEQLEKARTESQGEKEEELAEESTETSEKKNKRSRTPAAGNDTEDVGESKSPAEPLEEEPLQDAVE